MTFKFRCSRGLFYLSLLILTGGFLSSCGECEDNQWNRFWKIYKIEKCEYEPEAQQSNLEFPPSPMEFVNQT